MGDLIEEHLEDLKRSGLNDNMIRSMGARSIDPREVPGFEDGLYAKVKSVLELPYPNVEGFSRYKPFPSIEWEEDGKKKKMKYWQPKDSGNHLYLLPSVADVINDF